MQKEFFSFSHFLFLFFSLNQYRSPFGLGCETTILLNFFSVLHSPHSSPRLSNSTVFVDGWTMDKEGEKKSFFFLHQTTAGARDEDETEV